MSARKNQNISRRSFAAAVIAIPASLGLVSCGEDKEKKPAPGASSAAATPTSAAAKWEPTELTIVPIGDEFTSVLLTVDSGRNDGSYVYDVQMPPLERAEGIKREFKATNEQQIELGEVSLKSRGAGKVFYGGKSLLDSHQDKLHEVKKVPGEAGMGPYVVLESEDPAVYAVVFADRDVIKVEATGVRDVGLPENYLANEVFTIGRGA